MELRGGNRREHYPALAALAGLVLSLPWWPWQGVVSLALFALIALALGRLRIRHGSAHCPICRWPLPRRATGACRGCGMGPEIRRLAERLPRIHFPDES